MRILVTGGSGFLGSHVVEELVDKGYDVTVVFDKEKPGKIARFMNDVDFVHGDIRNFFDCRAAVHDVDAIIHLAALINVDHSYLEPEKFYAVNVQGTVNLLEAARRENIKKFVYMSTCEVYGCVEKGVATEKHPVEPRSPYGASKFAGERYVIAYHHAFKNEIPTEFVVMRGFNIYGPRQTYGARGAVIPIFIMDVLNGQNPKVTGRGFQTRDYVFVKDTAHGLVLATVNSGLDGEVINLASGKEQSIRTVAKKIIKLSGKNLKPVFVDSRKGEIKRSCGSYAKARRLLGWTPQVDFDDGLKLTFEDYRRVFEEKVRVNSI